MFADFGVDIKSAEDADWSQMNKAGNRCGILSVKKHMFADFRVSKRRKPAHLRGVDRHRPSTTLLQIRLRNCGSGG